MGLHITRNLIGRIEPLRGGATRSTRSVSLDGHHASAINREFFFLQTRTTLFSGSLRQTQVKGLNVLLDYWESHHAREDDRWLAYTLATAHHETDRSMQPIREYGSDEYKRLKYDVTGSKPDNARRNGNTKPGDGVKYAGRGYVQLTWKNNYRKAGDALGVELVARPDDAMQPATAAAILFEGMIDGWFTGRRLADCFNDAGADWKNARRIVNGVDKADLIKSYGLLYYAAISYTI